MEEQLEALLQVQMLKLTIIHNPASSCLSADGITVANMLSCKHKQFNSELFTLAQHTYHPVTQHCTSASHKRISQTQLPCSYA